MLGINQFEEHELEKFVNSDAYKELNTFDVLTLDHIKLIIKFILQ